LICLENPWETVGIAWKILGFSFELTLISLSESSLFKGLRGPPGPFFYSRPDSAWDPPPSPSPSSASASPAALARELSNRPCLPR
jgi:hypothetical protein